MKFALFIVTLLSLFSRNISQNSDTFNIRNPYVGINYIIALEGIFPSPNRRRLLTTQPFIGQIIMFGGNFAPSGWALCNGQLLLVDENQALFAIIGAIYGGDGRNTFALPDLRGRSPVHVGSGIGLTPISIGEVNGQETITIEYPTKVPTINPTIVPTVNPTQIPTVNPTITPRNSCCLAKQIFVNKASIVNECSQISRHGLCSRNNGCEWCQVGICDRINECPL